MVPDRQKMWTDGHTDDAKIISLRLRRGIIKIGKERQCHITKQLVLSFSVNIRISQPSKVMFTSALPR